MGVVWKEEFKFATTHIIAEDMPEITALSDGRFLATWRTGEFSGGDIFNYSDIRARILNADGTPVGDDFQVNTTTLFVQNQSSLTASSAWTFLLSYGKVGVLLSAPDSIRGEKLDNQDGSPSDRASRSATLTARRWVRRLSRH